MKLLEVLAGRVRDERREEEVLVEIFIIDTFSHWQICTFLIFILLNIYIFTHFVFEMFSGEAKAAPGVAGREAKEGGGEGGGGETGGNNVFL